MRRIGGFYIYNNRFEEGLRDEGKPYDGGRAENGVPIKFWYYDGWVIDCKIYGNYIEKSWIPRYPTDGNGWPFAIEATNEAGLEIYDNTIIGTIDTNYGTRTVNGKTYDYSIYIHDNTIGPESYTPYKPYDGICLEGSVDDVLIERNKIRNCCPAIWAHSDVGRGMTNLTIRYNLCTGIRCERADWYQEGIALGGVGTQSNPRKVTNLFIYNNVLQGVKSSLNETPGCAIELECYEDASPRYSGENINIANNIITGFGEYWLTNRPAMDLSGYTSFNGLNIENNIFFNIAADTVYFGASPPTDYVFEDNITGQDPLFISNTDFHLKPASPAVDGGKQMLSGSLIDIEGNAVPFSPVTVIPPPTLTGAVGGDGVVYLSFALPEELSDQAGAVSYIVEYKSSSDSWNDPDSVSVIEDVENENYTVTNLSNNVAYDFRVILQLDSLRSVPSNTLSETPSENSVFTVSVSPPEGYADATVYIDGIAHTSEDTAPPFRVEIAQTDAIFATMYKYSESGVVTGMSVWRMNFANGAYTTVEIPQFTDLLTYHGFSIRISGNSGIRFKSGIDSSTRALLLSQAGYGGYRLLEYGTLVMNYANYPSCPLVKDDVTKFGKAYYTDNNGRLTDAVFEIKDGRYRFTSVLTGLPVSQYKTEFAFRSYAIISDGQREYTLYGPIVHRSIYTIANQVLSSGTLEPNSAAYRYVQKIITDSDNPLR